MPLIVENKEYDDVYVKEIKNKKKKNGITIKSEYKTLESEVMEYFTNDCNQGNVNIATKSNILLHHDPEQKKLIIKAFAKGKLCLLNTSASELQRIVDKYGYKYEINND